MADLAVWQRTIVDETGLVVPGAEIEVRHAESGALAQLYQDREGTQTLSNPTTADMSGFVRFFIEGGAYDITATGSGASRTWRFDATGRLKEFDKVVAEIVTDDAGEQADIRDKLGAVSRTANLSDLTNPKEARTNLGTFSTVAEAQSRHIPAALESIRANGVRYDSVASEPSHAGKVRDAGGRWFEIAERVITPDMLGAKGDMSLEQDAVVATIEAAAALGVPIQWSEEKRYRIDETVGLDIPDGQEWRGHARFILGDGVCNMPFRVGANCNIEVIEWSAPGSSGSIMTVQGDRTKIGRIRGVAAVDHGETAVYVRGNHVEIGRIQTFKYGRPLAVGGVDDVPITGVKIGFMDFERYIRGLSLTTIDGFEFGGYWMRERSPQAVVANPGHNGMLITRNVRNGKFGSGRIEDSAEHAIRFSGSIPGTVVNENVDFGTIVVRNSGGCAFKLNSTGGTTERISVDAIIGVNIGEGSDSGNREVARLSHCRAINIGRIHVTEDGYDRSCRSLLRLNNAQDIHVGDAYVRKCGTQVVWLSETGDSSGENGPGDVRNVTIENLTAEDMTNGSLLNLEMPNYKFGGIFINNLNMSKESSPNVIHFDAGTTASSLDGPVVIRGEVVSPATPTFPNVPNDSRIYCDLKWGAKRAVGMPERFTWRGSTEIVGPRANPDGALGADVNEIFLTNDEVVPPAVGVYGQGISFQGPATTRRAAGVAVVQTGTGMRQCGLAFFRSGPSTSNEFLALGMILNHLGDLEFSQIGRGPILQSPNGTAYRIVVSDAGEISAEAV